MVRAARREARGRASRLTCMAVLGLALLASGLNVVVLRAASDAPTRTFITACDGGGLPARGLADSTYSAITQQATAGRVDWREVGKSFVTGAVLSGSLHMAATGARSTVGARGGQAAQGARRGSDGRSSSYGDSCAVGRGRVAAGAMSFSGDTLVLMGDGTKKPIEDVEVGDMVVATDLESGEQSAKRVTHVWAHKDTVFDLSVAPRGPPGAGETITTTEDHPFYNATDGEFQEIQDFDEGDRVATASGQLLELGALDLSSGRAAEAYNLTVADTHTYHVGTNAVLVHNCGTGGPGAAPELGAGHAASSGTPEIPAGYSSFSKAKRDLGSPGKGNVFDHVVEQSQINRSNFAPEEIHNPFNMNPVPAGVNQIKANYYSRKFDFTNGGTVRDWLSGQSFEAQYRFGMQTLSDIRAGLIQ